MTATSNMHDDIEKIIQAGILAPSGDNIQPWKFEVKGNTIDIYAVYTDDPSAVLRNLPSAMYCAHGALIENISIAADHFGYHARVTLLPTEGNDTHIARIELEEDATDYGVDLYRFIDKRCTNRKKYLETPLTPQDRDCLLDIPAKLGFGARVVIIDDRNKRRTLAHLITTQVQILFSHKKLHNEFYETLRWTNKEVYATRDGLDVRTLELPLPQRIMLRYLFRTWPVVWFLSLFGAQKMVAYMEAERYASAGAYCALLMKNVNVVDRINAGRIMERMWLEATKRGIAVQPSFATILLKRVMDELSPDYYSPKQQKLLKESTLKMERLFGITEDEEVMVILRIGMQDELPIRALRGDTHIIQKS